MKKAHIGIDIHQSRQAREQVTQPFENHRLHRGISIPLGAGHPHRHASVATGVQRNLEFARETRASTGCHVVRCDDRHRNMDSRKDE